MGIYYVSFFLRSFRLVVTNIWQLKEAEYNSCDKVEEGRVQSFKDQWLFRCHRRLSEDSCHKLKLSSVIFFLPPSTIFYALLLIWNIFQIPAKQLGFEIK